jgi:hypothetical protein
VIKPVFTSTPYSQYAYGSFYAFYKAYRGATGNITTHLNWLNTSVMSGMQYSDGWGHTYPLYSFISSEAAKNCGLVLGQNVHIISDINVSDGGLFDSKGKRAFDAIVIGHQEYVTQAEYDQMRLFVASGGLLVAMSSNMFYGKVRYNPTTLAETFVTGHGGYAFNGHTAWYKMSMPPPWDTGGWLGSTYCCFHRFHYAGATVNGSNPVGNLLKRYFGNTIASNYTIHEENGVSNFTGTSIIATFLKSSGVTVASYVHRFGRGAVSCFCVFGEDLLSDERSTQYFLVASLVAGMSVAPGYPIESSARGSALSFAVYAGILGAVVLAVPIMIHYRRAQNKGE